MGELLTGQPLVPRAKVGLLFSGDRCPDCRAPWGTLRSRQNDLIGTNVGCIFHLKLKNRHPLVKRPHLLPKPVSLISHAHIGPGKQDHEAYGYQAENPLLHVSSSVGLGNPSRSRTACQGLKSLSVAPERRTGVF